MASRESIEEAFLQVAAETIEDPDLQAKYEIAQGFYQDGAPFEVAVVTAAEIVRLAEKDR